MDAKLQLCAKYSYLCYAHPCSKLLYMHDRHTTYIGFRGVNTVHDMKQALTIAPTKYKNTNVHSGFINKYQTIKPKLQTKLRKTHTSNVVFLGHSMGGCIALIAAVDSVLEIKELSDKDIYCYTFGSPPVGDADFMNLAYATLEGLTCVELANDIVPKLPLNPFFVPITNLKIDNYTSKNNWDIIGNHSSLTYFDNLKI